MAAVWLIALAGLFLLLVVVGFLRKAKTISVAKLLFPVGYRLYLSRLGYYHHLRRLRKKSKRLHSIVEPVQIGDITIYPLAVLEDNYSYLIVDSISKVAVVVDPADPVIVESAVKEHGIYLKGILTTHKHWDHAGGNEALKQRFPCLTVYGSKLDNPSGTTYLLENRDSINIGALQFTAISTPGHTTGHMIYLMTSSPPCLFSGDHLFLGGCGKIFEGSAQQMADSLNLVKKLDPSTFIFPGHEYTHSNLLFSAHLEPDSTAVKDKLLSAKQLRSRRLATVPATLQEELQYNPFLRTDSPRLKSVLGFSSVSSQADVLAELRRKKNAYSPTQTTQK